MNESQSNENNNNDNEHNNNHDNNNNMNIIKNEYSVCCSAPGKCILFGEHAVVYGYSAIAASLSDLRINVIMTPIFYNTIQQPQPSSQVEDNDVQSSSNNMIHIYMPDLLTKDQQQQQQQSSSSISSHRNNNEQCSNSTSISIPMNCIRNILLQKPPTIGCSTRLEEIVKNHIIAVSSSSNDNDHDQYHPLLIQSIIPLLYLIYQILLFDDNDDVQIEKEVDNSNSSNTKLHHRLTGLYIYVQSKDLPVGAGLGSSAAFGVACSGALIQLREKYYYNNSISIPILLNNALLLDEIHSYSYYSEMILHGNPSGIDNAVSCYGGAILYDKKMISSTNTNNDGNDPIITSNGTTSVTEQQSQPVVTMKRITMNNHNNNIQLMLIDTGISRSTKQLVSNVKQLYEQYPKIMIPIMESIHHISLSFYQYILSSFSTSSSTSSSSSSVDNHHNGNNNNDNDHNSQEENKCATTNTTTNFTTYNNASDDDNSLSTSSISLTSKSFLLQLVHMNQCLLQSMNVSNECIEYICQTVHTVSNGYAAAKLTGAGGGGCCMILFHPNLSMNEINIIQQKIEYTLVNNNTNDSNNTNDNDKKNNNKWNLRCFKSTVGGEGVMFLLP